MNIFLKHTGYYIQIYMEDAYIFDAIKFMYAKIYVLVI